MLLSIVSVCLISMGIAMIAIGDELEDGVTGLWLAIFGIVCLIISTL